MRRIIPSIAMAALVSACAQPGIQYEASRKSAVELRAIQARLLPADKDTAMRGVVTTLHDLGYRITKVEPGAGTVAATRGTVLRLAVVVSPHAPRESVVRANATLVALRREAQVDAAEFYQANFFSPLAATMQRDLALLPADATAPEAMMPIAERNTVRERAAANPASATSPATGNSPR